MGISVQLRRIAEDDRDWVLDLCRRKYGTDYDYISTEGWFREQVLKNPLRFLPIRTDGAFLVAMLSCSPWTPALFEAEVILICADDGRMWDALHLLRYSIEWARQRKCSVWRIGVGWDFPAGELGPLAKRVGAKEIKPMYMVDLRS